MKIFLILLFVASTFGQSIQERVDKFDKPKSYVVAYEKFQNETSVTFETTLKGAYTLEVSLIAFIKNGDTSFMISCRPYYSTSFYNRKQRLLYDHDTITFLADGEPLRIPSDDIEYLFTVPITPDQMRLLAKSKTIEMQIATFQGKFNDKLMSAVRNLESLVN